jgi:hypothetical protein
MRMAVIGDSIQWGVGLKEENKICSLVKHALNLSCDISVDVQNFAQTGALIESPDNWEKDLRRAWRSETPQSEPNILNQIDFVHDPTTIDILLLNGGINDMDVGGYKNLWAVMAIYGSEEGQLKRIRQSCVEVFTGKLEKLFRKVFTAFPNALKIYTGYYPIISMKSHATFLEHYYAVHGWELRDLTTEDEFNELAREFNDYVMGRRDPGKVVFTNIRPRVARNCMEFYLSSSALAQETAQRINQEYEASPNKAIHVVTPQFSEEEAAFAPKSTSRFWGLKSGPETFGETAALTIIKNFYSGFPVSGHEGRLLDLLNYQSEDETKSKRNQACEDAWLLTPVKDTLDSVKGRMICRRASVAHPNKIGAKRYAQTISNVLYEFYPPVTYTFPAIDAGYYTNAGIHQESIKFYNVGRNHLREYRNFFVFDVTPLMLQFLKHGLSWEIYLEIHNPKMGFMSPQGQEKYVVSSVAIPLEDLRATHIPSAPATSIFNALGTGTVYGQYTASSNDNDAILKVGLYPTVHMDVRRLLEDNSVRLKRFAVGGRLVTLDDAPEGGPWPGEYLFAYSYGVPEESVRLVFKKLAT